MNIIHCLPVEVYRSAYLGDCTYYGISSRFQELLVVCPDGYITFDADKETPINLCVVGCTRWQGETYYHLVPAAVNESGQIVKRAGRWYMMGGNYAATPDSRFSSLLPHFHGAIAIHDRWEGRKKQ